MNKISFQQFLLLLLLSHFFFSFFPLSSLPLAYYHTSQLSNGRDSFSSKLYSLVKLFILIYFLSIFSFLPIFLLSFSSLINKYLASLLPITSQPLIQKINNQSLEISFCLDWFYEILRNGVLLKDAKWWLILEKVSFFGDFFKKTWSVIYSFKASEI